MLKVLAGCCLASLLCLASCVAAAAQSKEPVASPQAKATLEKCLERLAALKSYEVRFQQEARTPVLQTRGSGVLAVGPERKVLFELSTKRGPIEAASLLLSDGATVWRREKLGDHPQVDTFTLAEMDAELAFQASGQGKLDLSDVQELKKDLECKHGFRGLLPMLEDLSRKLVFSSQEEGTLERDGAKRPVIILDGSWSKEVRTAFIPPKQEPAPLATKPGEAAPTRPAPVDPAELYERALAYPYYPRKAKLFLDRETLLPLRLEWWGPTKREGQNELIAWQDWGTLKPLTPTELAERLNRAAGELAAHAKPLDFRATLRQQAEVIARQRKRQRELQGGRTGP